MPRPMPVPVSGGVADMRAPQLLSEGQPQHLVPVRRTDHEIVCKYNTVISPVSILGVARKGRSEAVREDLRLVIRRTSGGGWPDARTEPAARPVPALSCHRGDA